MELIGLLFIVFVVLGLVGIIYNKHRNLKNITPDITIAEKQSTDYIGYRDEAEMQADIDAVEKRGY